MSAIADTKNMRLRRLGTLLSNSDLVPRALEPRPIWRKFNFKPLTKVLGLKIGASRANLLAGKGHVLTTYSGAY